MKNKLRERERAREVNFFFFFGEKIMHRMKKKMPNL